MKKIELQLISIVIVIFVINFNVNCVTCNNFNNYSFINLPHSHLPYYFNNYPIVGEQCLIDESCEYREFLLSENYKRNQCWGYEDGCDVKNSFKRATCPGNHIGYVKSKEAQIDTFYTQADFGYIKEQRNELRIMCEPLFPNDSSLECTKYSRFCRGRNIMVNFTDLLYRHEPIRYKMDVLTQGQIGGYCKLHKERLQDELDHVSALQSWAPELRYFVDLPERPIDTGKCDIVIEKPTFFMKIDATINMYHHFCDFFNLYASLHVNSTHPLTFNTDNNILVWESFTYNSPFAETFKAFTKNPILDLKTFRGEVVCFKNLMLPLLPRMIFGLYYNTPLIYGCENSGLFDAFSEHILHRLDIHQNRKPEKKLRITFLSRQTKFRKILNEKELIDSISQDSRFHVNRVTYDKNIPFTEQLKITHNTDLLIGMHGAGLTHLLFLPKWATVFELYNCEDPNCYKDLARLRGVNYVTWEDDELLEKEEDFHPDGGRHPKFANYRFNVDEFVRIVNSASDTIIEHEEFQQFLSHVDVNENHDEL